MERDRLHVIREMCGDGYPGLSVRRAGAVGAVAAEYAFGYVFVVLAVGRGRTCIDTVPVLTRYLRCPCINMIPRSTQYPHCSCTEAGPAVPRSFLFYRDRYLVTPHPP